MFTNVLFIVFGVVILVGAVWAIRTKGTKKRSTGGGGTTPPSDDTNTREF